jgi:hypothetical protein
MAYSKAKKKNNGDKAAYILNANVTNLYFRTDEINLFGLYYCTAISPSFDIDL